MCILAFFLLFHQFGDILVNVGTAETERQVLQFHLNGVEPETVIKRMAAQNFDISKVDAIIRNEGSLDQLEAETGKVFRKLEM